MPQNNWLTCVPAYSRDYASAEAVLADWLKSKDFLIRDVSCPWNGRYVNKDDGEPLYDVYKIRYGKLRNFCLIKLVEDTWTMIGKEDGSDNEEASETVEVDGGAEGDHGVES